MMSNQQAMPEMMDRIRELHRGHEPTPADHLRALLLMFAEANKDPDAAKIIAEVYGDDRYDGRSVPMCFLYGGAGPGGESFSEPLPYLWSKLDEFVRSLNDPALDQVNEQYGMDGSD
jgi:hypothetical protein